MPAKLIPDVDEQLGELDFSLNGFNKQSVLRGVYAYARLIDRLLRKRKGTNPSDPDMGVDLDSYRFSDINLMVAGSLRNVILTQISTYIPNLPIQDINVSTMKYKNDYILYIKISIIQENLTFQLAYLQRKRSIINTKIIVNTPKLINTNGS